MSRRTFLGAAGAAPLLALRTPDRVRAVGAREAKSVDVVIVGSTLSGLVAARQLRASGIRAAVVGTAPPERDIEPWVSEHHHRLRQLARDLGVTVRRLPRAGVTLAASGGEVRTVLPDRWSGDGQVAAQIDSAVAKLDGMAAELSRSAPWEVVNAPVRDTHTLGSWLDRSLSSSEARNRLTSAFELVLGSSPSSTSLLFALCVVSSAGGTTELLRAAYQPEWQIVGGLTAVTDALVTDLGTSIAGPVQSVDFDHDSVTVSTSDCEFRARRIIAARWDPTLEAAVPRQVAARRFTPGLVVGAVCRYSSAFWTREGLSGRVIGDGAPLHSVQPVNGGASLAVVIAGSSAQQWTRLDVDARRQVVFTSLRRWFGTRAATPLEYTETTGATTTRVTGLPGALTTVASDLRDPWGPFHWGGAETATEWISHAEGSVEAGQRVAAEVITAVKG